VVFNEMKGVYSSPDSMNARATQQALFPANTYADDSGGNPEAIPDLTFEECAAWATCQQNSPHAGATAKCRQ
jgi:Zn-dependent M16 (insulinase) family peptidase